MILAPNIDVHAVTGSGAEVWSIHVPTDVLDESLDTERLGTRVIESRPSSLAEIRAAIKFALQIDRAMALEHYETHFANLLQTFVSSDESQNRPDRYHRRHKRKALFRAMEFIEAHLTRPLRIGQVCAYAGHILSTCCSQFLSRFNQRKSGWSCSDAKRCVRKYSRARAIYFWRWCWFRIKYEIQDNRKLI